MYIKSSLEDFLNWYKNQSTGLVGLLSVSETPNVLWTKWFHFRFPFLSLMRWRRILCREVSCPPSVTVKWSRSISYQDCRLVIWMILDSGKCTGLTWRWESLSTWSVRHVVAHCEVVDVYSMLWKIILLCLFSTARTWVRCRCAAFRCCTNARLCNPCSLSTCSAVNYVLIDWDKLFKQSMEASSGSDVP